MRKTIAFGLVAMLAVVSGCTNTLGGSFEDDALADLPQVTIGMSYIPNIQFAPFYVAENQKLFRNNGVNASLRHHGVDEGLFTAIAAGQEQFVVAGGDEALQAINEGIELVAIASYYREYPVRIITLTDSGINKLADLKGKRIGLPGRYGESWFGLLVALRSAGLAESDVEIVEIGYTQQVALSTKQVDATVGFINNDYVQFQLAGVDVKALPITIDVDPPLVGASLFTTQNFLTENPDAAKAVAKALVASIEMTNSYQSESIQIAADFIPNMNEEAKVAAKATLEATMKIMIKDGEATGKLNLEQWQDMADFLVAVNVLHSSPDVSKVVDTEVISG